MPPDWIEATRTGIAWTRTSTSPFPEGSYRNQFWIEDPRSRSLMCRGVFGQLIHISWDTGMVVVKLSTYPDFSNVAYSVATLRADPCDRRRAGVRTEQHPSGNAKLPGFAGSLCLMLSSLHGAEERL